MRLYELLLSLLGDVTVWVLAAALFALTSFAAFRLRRRAREALTGSEATHPFRRYFLFLFAGLNFLTPFAFGILAAFLVIDDVPGAHRAVRVALLVAGILQFASWVAHFFIEFLDRKAERHAIPISVSALGVVRFIGQGLIWLAALLLTLDNLGVNVTTLITGLGIGGIAVALAAQNILGDVFASLAIIFDRPFEVGDAVAVGSESGTIEHIGVKTTRIRSLSGEQIIINNSDLLQSRIKNFKRMQERRVLFTLNLSYETAVEELRALPPAIRGIIEKQENVRFERAHFREHGESALIFEVVYFVTTPDFGLHMDIRQSINLALHEYCHERRIALVIPSRIVCAEPQIGGSIRP